MRHCQTRDGRIGPVARCGTRLLYLAVSALLLPAGTAVQAQSDTKIITLPPPPPVPMLPPTGTAAGSTAHAPAASPEIQAAPYGSELEAKVGMPTPLPRQNILPMPAGPGQDIPRVIPIEPLPGQLQSQPLPPARPKLIQLRRDSTGLVSGRPPGPTPRRTNSEVAKDVSGLIEKIQEPEAELALVAGECKVIQTKRTLSRIVVSNPQVADVELLADQPEARLLNVTGKSFGNTTLTLWDDKDHPVSFLVRVTVDSKEMETRINQAFPAHQVKIRQVGGQIILDGQVPEAKMMSDIIQVVQNFIRMSPGFRASWAWAAA